MTAFLASVRSATEARLVLDAGVDVLDVKEPDAGALGAVSDATLREIVACAEGRVPVSATVGDLPMVPEHLAPAMERTWQAGVNIVKVGVFADRISTSVLSMLTRCSADGMNIVLVCFAEQWRDDVNFHVLQQTGVVGVMLDTRDKHNGSLTTKLGRAVTEKFVRQARDAGLVAGLAGSLGETDIPDLLSLSPDYLGFRGALCGNAERSSAIDPAAVHRIAARIHAHAPRRPAVQWRRRPFDSIQLLPA